jgi:hypothetical protein
MLHSITHLLYGFFAIDSYFCILIEDSHWVWEGLQNKIETAPSQYRLFFFSAGYWKMTFHNSGEQNTGKGSRITINHKLQTINYLVFSTLKRHLFNRSPFRDI